MNSRRNHNVYAISVVDLTMIAELEWSATISYSRYILSKSHLVEKNVIPRKQSLHLS